MSSIKRWFCLCLLLLAGSPVAYAQFAVIDVASVTQLVTQVRTLQQQLVTTRDLLTQTRAQLEAMSGDRGMERLLAGTLRNYLPPDWTEIENTLRGASVAYGALSTSLHNAVEANAVLSARELSALAPRDRQQIEAARRSAALLQVLAREALGATSGRFVSLQQLIEAIPRAVDQKGILDLQARIGAEQGMLQNDQTKLQVLFQAAQAQEWVNQQHVREQVVAGHGRFGGRFQPILPGRSR